MKEAKVLCFQPLESSDIWLSVIANVASKKKGVLLLLYFKTRTTHERRKKHKSPLCFWSLWSLHILEVTTTTTSSSSFSSPMAYPSCSVTSINLRTADRSNRGSFCRSSHMGKSRWSSKRLKVLARLLKHQYSYSYFYDHHFSILFWPKSLCLTIYRKGFRPFSLPLVHSIFAQIQKCTSTCTRQMYWLFYSTWHLSPTNGWNGIDLSEMPLGRVMVQYHRRKDWWCRCPPDSLVL